MQTILQTASQPNSSLAKMDTYDWNQKILRDISRNGLTSFLDPTAPQEIEQVRGKVFLIVIIIYYNISWISLFLTFIDHYVLLVRN